MARNELSKHLSADLLFLPNSSLLAKLLDSCVISKSLRHARRVHARIIMSRFSSETFIHNRLIDVYAKCHSLEGARLVFDRMPHRNTFTWNAFLCALTKAGFVYEARDAFGSMPDPDKCSWNLMISGSAQNGYYQDALRYFMQMHNKGFELNEFSFASALNSCAGLMDLKPGIQIHGLMSKIGYAADVYAGSALLDLYSKCGNVESARTFFDGMTVRNTVSWNSLITCYEQNGPASEALELFVIMMQWGFIPDEVTLASVTSACASLSAINEGLQIHAHAFKVDKFRDDLILGNALVDMYSKCGRMKEARWIFDRMPIRSVVSGTSMVSGYAKEENIIDARMVFMKMTERNIVSWNALIAGYTQKGENEEALGLFLLLKRESVWPTHYTFGNLLNACANLADLQLGRQAHAHVLKHGFRFQSGPESDIFVGNSLLDMYVKCGSVEDGYRLFEKMVERDYVSWNALIVGFAQNGFGSKALEIFNRMLECGEKPDHVTLIGVLCACSHAGMVEEGRRYFHSMNKDFGLVPSKDHYTCMVDLLGRANCLIEAKSLIESMPMQPDAVVWGSLLGACKVHGNIELGEYVAEKLLHIDPENSGPYVLLSNMHAELGRWADVGKIRKLMRLRGVVKQPGCSWIDINNETHTFMVKDKSHPEIYSSLKFLTEQMKLANHMLDVVMHLGDCPISFLIECS
uniref:Uncharacterized protein n=1 Tax=Kalanchoe fedtschenkoi TaxID=63787 RepID=A0A7N0UGJ7_KALFE